MPVKEHRALLALRGEDLNDEIQETDPQQTGLKPLPPVALHPQAERTSGILADIVQRSRDVLSDEKKANMILLRGYSRYRKYPSLRDRFGLNAFAIASYPMYRGISRLLGMEVAEHTETISDELEMLRINFSKYDFFFIHVKPTDSRGEGRKFRCQGQGHRGGRSPGSDGGETRPRCAGRHRRSLHPCRAGWTQLAPCSGPFGGKDLPAGLRGTVRRKRLPLWRHRKDALGVPDGTGPGACPPAGEIWGLSRARPL